MKAVERSSIRKKIENRITDLQKGTIVFPADFGDVGDGESVKKALLRLERQGVLKRLAFGIYLYPDYSELVGMRAPAVEDIAVAIATRDKARIVPTGAYALNRLGLSTQVPLNAVYLTDGAPRKIKVGKRTILFKKTTPKNLSATGEISGLVIQALKAIGKGKVEPHEEQRVLELLQKEKPGNVEHDIALAPEWIRVIMKKTLGEIRR